MFRPLVDRPGTVSTCPKCNQPFRSADSPHAPLILNCCHVCCEECIRTTLCTERQIFCKECGEPSTAKTPLDLKLSNLRDNFPLSTKMIEEIDKLSQMKPVDESSIGFKSSKRRSYEKPSPNTSLHEDACDECHDVLAILKCLDCNGTLFCEDCYKKIHRFNTNQKHDYQLLSSNSFNPMEKKPEYANLLKQNREKLVKKQERIERSLMMLANADVIKEAKTSGIDVQKVGEDLKQFFLYCQNTVKCLENKVMREFESVAFSLENSQAKCAKELNHWHMEIVELIRDIYAVSGADFIDAPSVEKLLAKAHDLLEKPDIVLTKRPVNGSKKIEMPSSQWIHILEDQLNFDFGKPGEIYLVKNGLESDQLDSRDSTPVPLMSLPCPGDISDAFEKSSHSSLSLSDRSAFQYRQRRPSKTQSVQLPLASNGEYSGGDYRRSESVSDMEHALRNTRSFRGLYPNAVQISGPSLSYCGMVGTPRTHYDQKTSGLRANFGRQVRFKEGWKGPVFIACVTTPSYFYIQLESSLATLEKYRKFFSKAYASPPIDKTDIKIGNMYLAKCSDGEWYRVRFIQIIPNEESVLVTQIDTGRKELVDMSNLRRIDDIMKSAAMDPEIAIQCCIYECYPAGSTWRKEDNNLFIEMLKDKQVTMIVKKVQSNKLEVDLEWNENGSYMSIRDYMLMSKQACISIRKDNQNSIMTSDSMKYFKDREFQPKEWVDVKVTYVFGPDEIYIKRHDPCSEKRFENMNTQIDAFYKNNLNYKNYAVATFTVGLPVAAQFTIDNTWYRAEILNVFPQSKKAEVRYVDFGNKEIVPFSRIRLLAKEFIRFTIQTVRCSLVGIKPLVGTKYKPLATNFLIKNIEDLLLKMVVEDVKEDELSVILYKSDEDEDVCLNLLLVEERFAKKVGDILGAVSSYPKRSGIRNSMPKKAVEKEISIKTSEEIEVDTSKEIETETSKEIEVQSNDVDSDVDDEETENDSTVSSTEEVVQEDEVDNTSARKQRYEVKIISFISPNLFYVSLVAQLACIQKLTDDMSRFYRDEKNSNELKLESVEKDIKCVAYMENDKKWYRARVLEVNEDNEVTVFLKDIARKETVKSENLRELAPEFDKQIDGVVACHMANIEDRSEWPARLCESLMTALDGYASIYVTKLTKDKGKTTYPVEVWGKNVTCQGAFVPATEEYTNVNLLLAKALQNDDLLELQSGSNKEPNLKPKDLIKNLEEQIGEISSTETVKKWLHSSVVEAAGKGVEYTEIVANGEIPSERLYTPRLPTESTLVADDALNDEENIPDDVLTEDWKPPEPIDVDEFDVWPTYLDDDFCIYVQNLGKQRKLIDMISNGLQLRFENTTPLPVDLHWYPGQMCIAWFFMDKKWYRGKVLKVKDSKAFVEYVDFGNTEWVEMVHLRKDIILNHFPIQCHKLAIRSDCVSVSEDGKWPTKILDFIHVNILEKKCRIKLRKEKGEDFHRIEKLILEDTEIELFDYLCQLGYATFVSKSSAKRSKSGKEKNKADKVDFDLKNDDTEADDDDDNQTDSSSSIAVIDSVSNLDLSEFLEVPGVSTLINDPFSIPQNPQDNEVIVPYFDVPVADLNIVSVEVIEILQLDEIVVHIVDSENEAVNLNRKRFLEMNSELQEKGIDQPFLTSPSLGRMCCTKFDDNLWYRAKIIDHCSDNDAVNILYVDYGNSSRADPSGLREMKRSWFDVPMQSIRCRLIDSMESADGKTADLDEMLKLINNQYEAVLEACDDPHYYNIKLYFK